jgi:hypothetical protein
MASLSGVNQTLIDAGGISTIAGGLHDGRVKVAYDSVVVTSSLTTSNTVKLFGVLPQGAKVLQIGLSSTVTQASATFGIGDSDTATRYGTAIVLTTGTTGTHTQWYDGLGYVVGTTDGDDQILLTLVGATATAATWYATILYSTD